MSSEFEYDRWREVEEFENTKLGVKGLVDSGITRIPRIFHHPPETLIINEPPSESELGVDQDLIPVIDLSGPHPDLVERVREASVRFGFFQAINHGVPVSLLDRLVSAVKAFHHQLPVEKRRYHRREVSSTGSGVGFFSNYDLFASKAASWRDTLEIRLGPNPLDPNALPDVCRDEVMEWDKEVKQLGERLMELLSEGVGLSRDRLKGISYLGRVGLLGHYYPHCPEPDKTVGIASHTDAGILTVLLQDHVGGLQVKYDGNWVHVKPLHGALVINIGDLLQMITNDEYKSGEHRVLATTSMEPRVSIATFFGPGNVENLYGPLSELVSPEKPALYRQFIFSDFITIFLSKELGGKSMTSYFRL